MSDTQHADAPAADRPEPRLSGPDTCQIPGEDGSPVCVRQLQQRPCRTCPAYPAPSTPPAPDPQADLVPETVTPTEAAGPLGPGVLGRALLYADGSVGRILDEAVDAWRRAHPKAKRFPKPWREVLLVSPAAGRVLETAQRWQAAYHSQSNPPILTGNEYAGAMAYVDARAELLAAVDALDGDQPAEPGLDCQVPGAFGPVCVRRPGQLPCSTCPASSAPPESGPPPARVECGCGVPIVHSTPDGYGADGCDDPAPAEAAEDRAITASAERQWAADPGPPAAASPGATGSTPAAKPAPATASPATASHGLAEAEPAPEPASGPGSLRPFDDGDPAPAPPLDEDEPDHGPGWDREAIDATIRELDRSGPVDRARANQLRNLRAEVDWRGQRNREHVEHKLRLSDKLAEVTADRDRTRRPDWSVMPEPKPAREGDR